MVTRLASAFREFIAPRYRPELHYMRGPGPACARCVSERFLAGRSPAQMKRPAGLGPRL